MPSEPARSAQRELHYQREVHAYYNRDAKWNDDRYYKRAGITVRCALTGIGGSGSNLSLNANLLAFGSVAQGNISAGKTVTVTNIGNSDLHFTGTTTLSANFATANIGTCGSGAVTPGSSCTLSAEFVPTADGSIAGTMTIFTDAPGSTTTVALSGIGAPTLWPGATHVHVPAQYATIQAAIDAAVNGSNTVIHVGPGTYIENLDINKSGVDGTHRFVLVSDQKWGAKIVAATSPPQPFHFMIHVEANYVDIIGFEITGGSVGGGVSMSTVNGSPNLRMSEF